MDLSASIPVVTGAGRGLGRHLVEFGGQPPGFAVHAFLDDELISQLQHVG